MSTLDERLNELIDLIAFRTHTTGDVDNVKVAILRIIEAEKAQSFADGWNDRDDQRNAFSLSFWEELRRKGGDRG